eukprot:TRINITY_DN1009_c0_g1_i1.p1 TRINITY_DN1009_c0_g1~~TRINITY_DN1009_c0_g1_i1.p1  ORF type:complete len:325 (-),score=68.02 TRINITY_DN1009_c0_g1_i1:340-1314(-)
MSRTDGGFSQFEELEVDPPINKGQASGSRPEPRANAIEPHLDVAYDNCFHHVSNTWYECGAELLGTQFIVLTGGGSVCAAVLMGSATGIWQVAIVWGVGVALAVYFTASVSGGHLNPAVSLAMAIFRPKDFPKKKLLRYWGAQLLGGFLGGASNFLIYGQFINHYEKVHEIDRGSDESVRTAMIFGEYFPNPAFDDGSDNYENLMTVFGGFCIEAWGTGILTFLIFALTDKRNKTVPRRDWAPYMIGMTVSVLIAIYAPLTQAGWNPARDFGPRLVAAMSGWGNIAIPGPNGGFWIYILGPMFGACLGGLLYEFSINRALDVLH